tara:strand:- start:3973 stop:4362 length:390 start_codon:yes stop_codon:yes gene_type:complete
MNENYSEPIRLAIVGSRNYKNWNEFKVKVEETLKIWDIIPDQIETIVSGGASGADTLAQLWASKNKIPMTIYPPDWNKHRRAAGPIRNTLIIKDATHVIAFPSKSGFGTQDSISKAKSQGKPLKIHKID